MKAATLPVHIEWSFGDYPPPHPEMLPDPFGQEGVVVFRWHRWCARCGIPCRWPSPHWQGALVLTFCGPCQKGFYEECVALQAWIGPDKIRYQYRPRALFP